jgi:predicted GH43/DUF377 family glycosyl hydrolase
LGDPCRVNARLEQPLLSPDEHERVGYVPNLVYSCDALIQNGELMIPYAMSRFSSGLTSASLRELIDCMAPAE